ncbi:MAG: hypothetical protein PUE07_00320 [bacterium]|nr:hypothetical protein [bacterium]
MKNLNRSKIVGVAAVSLAAVSLIGVGFASWVVGGVNSNATPEEVEVKVGTVTDNRIDFSASKVDTAINFDCNSNTANPIKASYVGVQEGAQAPEDLSFSLKYSLSSTRDSNLQDLPVSVTVTVALTGSFITFMGNNTTLVSLETPAGFTKSDSGYTYTKSVSKKTTDEAITFKFKWGAAFLEKNPADITQSEFDANNEVTISSVLGNLKTLQDAAGTNAITATISASVAS